MDWLEKNRVSYPRTTPRNGVPLLDVDRENGPLRDQILAAMADVYDSGKFVLGPACERFEQQIAEVCGTRFAIGCASGSDALLLALLARDIGPGDEVIVPSFTFFATASAAWRLGAKPVFVDIEPATFCIDPIQVAAAVNHRTRAIIPVHLFGQSADMQPLKEIAAANDLLLVEDCAQSILSTYNGQAVGSIGDIGAFSFYPTKNLGGCGDGGILATSDETLYQRLRLFRAHGMEPRYTHHVVGINSRLDSIQAAILNVKLPHLLAWNDQRATNASNYHKLFSDAGLDQWLGLPRPNPNGFHVWNQFTVRVPNGHRDALRAHLAAAKIGTEVYYPLPLHLQPCFESLGYSRGDLPEAERAANDVLSLPIFPELTISEQQFVVDHIAEYHTAQVGTKVGAIVSKAA